MKALLRQLYQRVHPDRFSGQPVAQRDNLLAFQQLQSLLQRSAEAPFARERVRFHLLRPEEADALGEGTMQVACTLRSTHLEEDIRHLLRQCGMDAPDPQPAAPRGDSDWPRIVTDRADVWPFGQQLKRWTSPSPTWVSLRQPKPLHRERSLTAFLDANAAACREAQETSRRQRAAADELRRALRRRHGVDVVLTDRWIPSAEARMLADLDQQLGGASPTQLAALRGAQIRVAGAVDADGAAVDRWGALTVSAHAIHRKGLLQLADSLDPGLLARAQRRLQALLHAEQLAARRLRLRALSSLHPGLRESETYRELLGALGAPDGWTGPMREHLAAWDAAVTEDATAALYGAAEGPGPGLPQHGRPRPLWEAAVEPSAILRDQHTVRAHATRRLLQLPIHLPPPDLLRFLGIEAATAARQMAAREALLGRTRRALGARELTADTCLSDDQVWHACAALAARPPHGSEGLCLQLSVSFATGDSGACKLRWDFDP